MKSTELATKYKVISNELDVVNTRKFLNEYLLNNFGNNYDYRGNYSDIVKKLNHLDKW